MFSYARLRKLIEDARRSWMVEAPTEQRGLGVKDVMGLERSLRLFKYMFLNKPQPPFKLVLTPTDRCNLDCFFCPNYTARKQNRFSAEDEIEDSAWLDVIDQGVKLGVRQWCFLGGGEPLLRSDLIIPTIEKIKSSYKTMDLEIITNGTLFTDQIIKELNDVCTYKLRDGREHAAIQATISMHGQGETYKAISGYDAYDKVLGGIKSISRLKKASGLRNPVIQVNVVVNRKNISEIEHLVSAISASGADQIALHPIHVYDEIKDVVRDVEPTPNEYRNVLSAAERLKSGDKNLVLDYMSLSSYLQQTDNTYKDESDTTVRDEIASNPRYAEFGFLKYKCFEPWYDILINPSGMVARCPSFFTRDEPINIMRDSLKDIWFGDYLEKVRKNIMNNVPMTGCNPCALMSNTIIIRRELKRFIDAELKHDMSRLPEIERFIECWSKS